MDAIKGASAAVAMILGGLFLASPIMYALGKWHCFWHALAPACQ